MGNSSKGQIAVFVIIGLVVLFLAAFLIYNASTKQKISSEEKTNIISFDKDTNSLQSYFDLCSRESIIDANEEYGINEENKAQYESYVAGRIKNCMSDVLGELKKTGYSIEEGALTAKVMFYDSTISVAINYALTVSYDKSKFSLEEYKLSFPKEVYISTLKLESEDILLPSSDKRATLLFSKGTVATDANGNKVDKLGIKLIDKNFDGLENSIVAGNLVYEGLPDKTTFSQPVEISIDFREKDLPDVVDEDSLSIAWWDEEYQIWRALKTKVENGRATAQTTHFTKFAVILACGDSEPLKEIIAPTLYQQEYSYNVPAPTNLQDKQAVENYNKKLSEVNSKFCSASGNPYWQKNADGTITPTKAELIKIINNDPEKISPTVQEIQEKITYGLDPSCATHMVPAYCFCDANGQNCQPEIKGEQQWMRDIKDANLMIGVNLFEPTAERCSNTAKVVEDKGFIGYNNENCIPGRTDDGDGDNKIFGISFQGDGNSCVVDSDDWLTIIYDNVNCKDTHELIPAKEGAELDILSLIAGKEEGYCARCIPKIVLKAEGCVALYSHLCSPSQVGKFNNIKLNNEDRCAECVLDANGQYTYSKIVDNGNCGSRMTAPISEQSCPNSCFIRTLPDSQTGTLIANYETSGECAGCPKIAISDNTKFGETCNTAVYTVLKLDGCKVMIGDNDPACYFKLGIGNENKEGICGVVYDVSGLTDLRAQCDPSRYTLYKDCIPPVKRTKSCQNVNGLWKCLEDGSSTPICEVCAVRE
jgi:hypothetical protein